MYLSVPFLKEKLVFLCVVHKIVFFEWCNAVQIRQMKCLNVELKFYSFNDSFFSLSFSKILLPNLVSKPNWMYLQYPKMTTTYIICFAGVKVRTSFCVLRVCYITRNELICIFYSVKSCLRMHLQRLLKKVL